MFCKHCGKEINDNAVICPGCGIATDNYYKTSNPVPAQKNTMALLGFILSFFMPLVGLILSIIGYQNAKKPEFLGDGKSMSVAGIIISAIYMGIILIYVFILCMIWFSIIFMW